jgi:hypothetical protein
MRDTFVNVLRRGGTNGAGKDHEEVSAALEEVCAHVRRLLEPYPVSVRREIVNSLIAQVIGSEARAGAESRGQAPAPAADPSESKPSLPAEESCPLHPVPVPPEVLEEALRQYSGEEIVAAARELRQSGGFELSDFLHELEAAARPDE